MRAIWEMLKQNPAPIAAAILTIAFGYLIMRLKDRNTRKGICTMIGSEIENNLQLLRKFLTAVDDKVKHNQPVGGILKWEDALSEVPPPNFSHSIFQSSTSALQTSLKPDVIKKIQEFYSKLGEFKKLKIEQRSDVMAWSMVIEKVINDLFILEEWLGKHKLITSKATDSYRNSVLTLIQ